VTDATFRAERADIFSAIYRDNLWNGTESLSGPGSGSASTANVARDLVELVRELDVSSVLDVGCGDSFWMPDLPGYIGVDVTPEAVERARHNHPERRYEVVDATVGLPPADLVLCRDVIQHQSLRDALALVNAIRLSGARWLVASTYEGGVVEDIETGAAAWAPDLARSPFDLGEPERMIFDGYEWSDPQLVRDARKWLAVWRLA
jgi:SAM-dependent methyltransferase